MSEIFGEEEVRCPPFLFNNESSYKASISTLPNSEKAEFLRPLSVRWDRKNTAPKNRRRTEFRAEKFSAKRLINYNNIKFVGIRRLANVTVIVNQWPK